MRSCGWLREEIGDDFDHAGNLLGCQIGEDELECAEFKVICLKLVHDLHRILVEDRVHSGDFPAFDQRGSNEQAVKRVSV